MDYPNSLPDVYLHLGKFTDGTPDGVVPPSRDPADWANAVTDEILAVIVAAGLVPNEANTNQLRDAINALIAAAMPAAPDLSAYAQLAVTQSWTKAQRGAVIDLTDDGNPFATPNFDHANNYRLVLGISRTLLNPNGLTAGQPGVIVIIQDAVGGRTMSFGSAWKFASGTAPSLTTTANAVDVLAYYVESANRITGRLIKDVK